MNEASFIEGFRRADCLFTLVAEYHARCTDQNNERHGAGMVGRQKLVAAINRLEEGEFLNLDSFTASDSPQRYFLNRMGGLGQYYAGTLADLNILDGAKKPWYRYTTEIGKPLAEAFEKSVQADTFWKVIERGEVDQAELEALNSFCPCALQAHASDEHDQLLDIYFDRKNMYDLDGVQRKQSLALIQRLAESLSADCVLTEKVFRAATYGNSLSNGSEWKIPENLATTRQHWSTYVRNDLFSVATQAIFALALKRLAPQKVAQVPLVETIESFAHEFILSDEVSSLIDEIGITSFGEWLTKIEADLPLISDSISDDHEINLSYKIVAEWGKDDDLALLAKALQLIAILVIRDDLTRDPYEGLAVSPEALLDYPINLKSLRSKADTWRSQQVVSVIYDLIVWCMNTHLRISLRKLHRTNQATFRFRISERGLSLTDGEIPSPARTAPRFRQALQILLDTGALARTDSEVVSLTVKGKQLMEEVRG